MANVRTTEQPDTSVERGKDGKEHVVKGPVASRQGFRDTPVLWVLGISLVLCVIVYVVLHLAFIGGF